MNDILNDMRCPPWVTDYTHTDIYKCIYAIKDFTQPDNRDALLAHLDQCSEKEISELLETLIFAEGQTYESSKRKSNAELHVPDGADRTLNELSAQEIGNYQFVIESLTKALLRHTQGLPLEQIYALYPNALILTDWFEHPWLESHFCSNVAFGTCFVFPDGFRDGPALTTGEFIVVQYGIWDSYLNPKRYALLVTVGEEDKERSRFCHSLYDTAIREFLAD